jgi:hypothetical protein
MPNLNISVEDTVLGTGLWECPSLELALLGDEVISDLSCPAFAILRVQGMLISLRNQRCADSSVGLRRANTGISRLLISLGCGRIVSLAWSMSEQVSHICLVTLSTSKFTYRWRSADSEPGQAMVSVTRVSGQRRERHHLATGLSRVRIRCKGPASFRYHRAVA